MVPTPTRVLKVWSIVSQIMGKYSQCISDLLERERADSVDPFAEVEVNELGKAPVSPRTAQRKRTDSINSLLASVTGYSPPTVC